MPDLMAGITLAALGIPEVMGYTQIIGTPVITGLYTILLPMLVFALFGSSRHLVVGADSATAAIVAAALAPLAAPYSAHFVALTSLVALEAGAMLLLARVLRAGFLADFLSRTVLVGFLTGVGIQIALGQMPGMLGLEKGGHGIFAHLQLALAQFPHLPWPSPAIALCVLAVIVALKRFMPRFPGALLAVAGMIVASVIFHWADHGIKLVGSLPSGLPALVLPDVAWSEIPSVVPVAFSCFIVILAQGSATSRAYALRYEEPFDENVDLVGLSLANLAAGCSGTFVVNGSPTKTAMVDTAGGRSQVSQLATVAMVLLVLLFFTRPLSYLPSAALSAIVFLIGVKLIDYRGLLEIGKKSREECMLAIVTAGIVVILGVEQGIIAAMVLSLLDHVRHGYRPHTAIILTDPIEHWQMEKVAPGKMIEPGLVMYWFGADLYYANASYCSEQVRRLVSASPSPVRWLVIDTGAIADIDYTAAKMLRELHDDLAKQGVVLALTRVSDSLRADLHREDLIGVIGAKHIFGSRRDCIAAYRESESGTQGGARST